MLLDFGFLTEEVEEFCMKHHSVLVRSCTKFELNNAKFAQVTQFTTNFQKIQNLKKFELLNRFWSNSIQKVLDRCIIIVCISRTIAQILRKLQVPQTFFKKFKNP